MVSLLKDLGIEKGKKFDPTDEQKKSAITLCNRPTQPQSLLDHEAGREHWPLRQAEDKPLEERPLRIELLERERAEETV